MEKEKNNGVLVGIIIFLLMIILLGVVLSLKKVIKYNTENKNNNQVESVNKENNIQTDNNILSENEALSILKTKIDFAEKYFTTFQNPCGENAELDNTIPQKDGMPYYKSKEFNSYDELNNTLLKYMSQDVIDLRITYIKDYYLEKDGKLYCYMLSGGSQVTYNANKTEYKINEISSESINATVTSYLESSDNNSKENNITRNIYVILTKNNNDWQITKYDVKL